MADSTVTLAMCTHNPNPVWFREAINSVAGIYDEVIIVDDSDIPLPEATVHFSRNIRLPDARNVAVNMASSEYIAFLDDDDIILRKSIPLIRDTIHRLHPDVCYFPLIDIRENGSFIRSGWGYDVDMSKIIEENQISYASWFRKSLWTKIGGYQYEIEDWDFWVRAFKSGAKFVGVSEAGLKHRNRESNSRTQKFLVNNFAQIRKDIVNRAKEFTEGMHSSMPYIPHVTDKKKICFVVTATGKYISFVKPLVESMWKWCASLDFNVIVFTDSEECGDFEKVYVPHMPWPLSTTKRCYSYLANVDKFAGYDYVFAIDADMLFVSEVGEEIFGKTVATQHGGWWKCPVANFTYERRENSSAFIPNGKGSIYYSGAFYGGERTSFITMLEKLVTMTDEDLNKGIIAIWHDESYLNRYLLDNIPEKVLSPSYCCPTHILDFPFEKKIISISEKPEAYRLLKMDAKVSVVIPCFNYGRYLEESIQSVLNQDYGNFELILVNYGSTDNTAEVMAKYGSVAVIVSIHNKGYPNARNMGIKISTGEYVLCLDADDKLRPSFLSEVVVNANPAVIGAVQGQYFGDKSSVFVPDSVDLDSMFQCNRILSCSLFSKKMWKEIGGYDEVMERLEDWDFWLRSLLNGYRIEIIEKVLVDIRSHSTSVSGVDNYLLWERYLRGKMSLGFNEKQYLVMNDDVRDAVKRRDFSSGWEHFIKYGYRESHRWRTVSWLGGKNEEHGKT